MKHKVIIIGGGPAGLACVLQLKRYDIDALIIEKNHIGGLMRNANKVENYLGFPDGISGTDLLEKFIQQIKNNNIKIEFDEVIKLHHEKNEFVLKTLQKTYKCKIVVIATGTKPKKITGVNIEKEAADKVFYEVFDLKDTENKNIAIIGAGDAAFDYALTLSERNQVHIFNRGEKEKCLPLLYNKVSSEKNIHYHKRKILKSVSKKQCRLALIFDDQKKIDEHVSDYIIFAAGRKPEIDFFSDINKNEIDVLIKNKKLFMIGDVKNGIARQLAIATGDGIKAAMEVMLDSGFLILDS